MAQPTSVFAALANPRRLAILQTIAAADGLPVSAIAAELRAPTPTISRDLRVLEEAELIRRRRHGRRVTCHLSTSNTLTQASQVLADLDAFWHARFDRLAQVLEEGRRPRTHSANPPSP